MGLSVTVLGCSGSYPGPGGACSGYLVEDGRTRVWVDAGSGTLANLQTHCRLGEVDAVVLSHEHPDHWTDLEAFGVALRYALRLPGPPVYAPAGLHRHAYHGTDAFGPWHEVTDGDAVDIGSMALTFSRTDHGPETLAVRVDSGGRSIGYSADTGPAWSLEALGEGLDLAVCEATIPRSKEGQLQHLSAHQAGESARAARARALVLTHIWPTLDPERSRIEGADAFGISVEVATPHARYEA